MKNIYTILINFHSEESTIDCITSLKKLTIPSNFKNTIVVVDNESSENSVEKIKQAHPDILLLANDKNLGFAQGMNTGITYALKKDAVYLLLLNNDTIVDGHLLSELLKTIEDKKNIGIVVPKIYFAKGYEYHKNRYKENELGKIIWYAGGYMRWNSIIGHHRGVDQVDNGQFETIGETEYATGCCMFVPADVFKKVGFFDERYFLYYEDSDFSMRVKRNNYVITFTPQAKLWHKNAGSAGGSGSALQDYYISRNRLLFGMTYGKMRIKIAMCKESIRLLFNGRKWQKKGIRDFFLQKFYKGSYTS